MRGEGLTDGWVPFHKLSQWLTYSLLEPFEWAGVKVRGLDALTGLPEYRNGGLLLDTGVLRLRDTRPPRSVWQPGDEIIVEWRALTVALLDEMAPRRAPAAAIAASAAAAGLRTRRRHLGRRPRAGPAPAAACRRLQIAATAPYSESREPRIATNRANPTMSNVHRGRPPAGAAQADADARKETSTNSFRRLLNELAMLLAYEVTRDMPMQEVEIETPLEKTTRQVIDGKKLVFVSILRAGTGILDGMLSVVPGARVGHIGLYRDPKTLTAVEYYFKMPHDDARARRDRGRPDAGHRQLGRRRGRAAEGTAVPSRSSSSAC